MGNNGTGKTTLAQAFSWCLYGETSFKIESVLNKEVENNLESGYGTLVEVKIGLEHGDVKYDILREQKYQKKGSKIIQEPTEVRMTMKKKDGTISKIKEWDREVRKILPSELSKYFFFDGERIEKMSKEIQGGKRSNEFAGAVRGLLGLNPIISALEHLKPRSKYSVVGRYEESYNQNSNSKVKDYTHKLNGIISRARVWKIRGCPCCPHCPCLVRAGAAGNLHSALPGQMEHGSQMYIFFIGMKRVREQCLCIFFVVFGGKGAEGEEIIASRFPAIVCDGESQLYIFNVGGSDIRACHADSFGQLPQVF